MDLVVRYDGQTKSEDTVEVFLNHVDCEINNINNTFAHPKSLTLKEQNIKYQGMLPEGGYMKNIGLTKTNQK